MRWEEAFRRKASMQEGLVARFQAASLGCTPADWWNACRSPDWTRRSPRVIALRGVPRTEAQRVTEGVLDASPGAFLHATCALAWLGMPNMDLRRIIVARPYGLSGSPSTLAEVHRLRSVRAHDILVVRGVATETALRAIWVEAARWSAPRLIDIGYRKVGTLLDVAHRHGLVTWAGLAEMVDDLQQRGRAGTVLMRALSEARPPGSSVTESRQEDRLEELLAQRGVRGLRRQIPVGGHEPIGRTDHRDERLPLVVETNSLTFHTTPTDQEADERRYAALNDAGFTVAVVWEPDLWARPMTAVETVVEGQRRASIGQHDVVHSPGCPWETAIVGSDEAVRAAHAWNLRLAA